MTVPLVIVRPEPGAERTAARARDQGWHVVKTPLFAVSPVPWEIARNPTNSENTDYDALMIASANVFRCAGNDIGRFAKIPLYVVGDITAMMARHHGFTVTYTGSGGVSEVLPELEADGCRRVLWLSGRDTVPLPPHSLTIDRVTIYRSDALPMPDRLRETLASPAVILLHSARAAEHVRAECVAARIDLSGISVACFGPRIAAAAGPGWGNISTARAHNDQALLEVARQLCKT